MFMLLTLYFCNCLAD